MQLPISTTLFSATDLVAYFECERLTVLDFQALGDGRHGGAGQHAVLGESWQLE